VIEVVYPVCGNNVIEKTEICDGTNLDNKTCVTQGFTGGTLACDNNCLGFNTNQCQGPPGVCGDGTINPGEDCDGDNLNGKMCVNFDHYIGGNLVCNQCQFDYFGCKECNTNNDCGTFCCKQNKCVDFNQCQISPNPSVDSFYPEGMNVCLNKEIGVTFSHLMNKETLNSSNISLKKGETIIEGEIISRDENNKTITIFSPTNYLEKDTKYKVTIKKEVKDKDGLTMKDDQTWIFITGKTLCQINHIEITINGTFRNDDLFVCADNNCSGDQEVNTTGNQHIYIAQAKDKNKENISANYIWGKQDRNGILSAINSITNTQIVTSQRKNGEAIVLVQANMTDSPSKATEIKVNAFMCENPWAFGNPTKSILKDDEMGFELFYCRDR
jgi:hypothetical protein